MSRASRRSASRPTSTPATTPAPAAPLCEHCREHDAYDAEYETEDRHLHLLLVGLALSFGLTARFKDTRSRATLLVHSHDRAAIERFSARFSTLARSLDDHLHDATIAFVKQHCGVTLYSSSS